MLMKQQTIYVISGTIALDELFMHCIENVLFNLYRSEYIFLTNSENTLKRLKLTYIERF